MAASLGEISSCLVVDSIKTSFVRTRNGSFPNEFWRLIVKQLGSCFRSTAEKSESSECFAFNCLGLENYEILSKWILYLNIFTLTFRTICLIYCTYASWWSLIWFLFGGQFSALTWGLRHFWTYLGSNSLYAEIFPRSSSRFEAQYKWVLESLSGIFFISFIHEPGQYSRE